MKRFFAMMLLCACGTNVEHSSQPAPANEVDPGPIDAGPSEPAVDASPGTPVDPPPLDGGSDCTAPGSTCTGCASCDLDDHGESTFVCEPVPGMHPSSSGCQISAPGTRSLIICKDSSCKANCYGGYCTMLCLGSASCDFDCTGGHCIYDCATTGTCQLDAWAVAECPAPSSDTWGECFQCGAANAFCACSTDSDCPAFGYLCGDMGVCVAWS